MNEMWNLAMEAAVRLVTKYREEAVGDPQAIDFARSDTEQTQQQNFSRQGASISSKDYTLPANLLSLIQQAFTSSQDTPELAGAETGFLTDLISRDVAAVPGQSTLLETQGIDPENFSGQSSLNEMALRNPYSQDYESAIGALYDRQFAQARANAQSGPQNVRGGTARQGFELAELGADQARNKFRDVRGQQDKEAGVVQGAVQLLNTIESLRRGVRLQAQQQQMMGESSRAREGLGAASGIAGRRSANSTNLSMAADMIGKPKVTTKDNLTGQGIQQGTANTNSWNAGVTCCFIFLEALNGELPLYVRKGRDEFCTTDRRVGYVWMSLWLCPLMRRFTSARFLVNLLLVKPFLCAGEVYYNKHKTPWKTLLKPYCYGWFRLWDVIGKTYALVSRLNRRVS